MTKSFDAHDYLVRRARNEGRLGAAGVYSPDMEHDACGVGFVAARDGQPNRAVVESAIEALQAIWHRGAVDADGMTGDGAGIHIEIPRDFFIEHIARTGHDDDGGRLAVGIENMICSISGRVAMAFCPSALVSTGTWRQP